MAKTLTRLTLFVSCPGDVAPEARTIRTIVDQMNPQLEDAFGVTIQVLTWQDDVAPGVGSSAQAVINQQIGDSYDLYVGILAAKFGAPTTAAGSGTEEEFDRAYARWLAAAESIRILFYFKDSLPSGLHTMDLGDLERVRQFRDKLSHAGVLYRQFSDTEDFVRVFRTNLWATVAHQWGTKGWQLPAPSGTLPAPTPTPTAYTPLTPVPPGPVTPAPHPDTSPPEADVDEASGLLDHVTEAEEELAAATHAVEAIAVLITRIGAQLEGRTVEITSIGPNASARERKQLINATASEISAYGRELQEQVAKFSAHIGHAFDSFDEAVSLEFRELTATPDRAARHSAFQVNLRDFESTIRGVLAQTMAFRGSIAAMPGLTVELKRSRKLAVRAQDELQASLAITIDRAVRLRERIRLGGLPLLERLPGIFSVDVATLPRNTDGDFILPVFVEGPDYFDSGSEQWVQSIGRHRETGQILASTTAKFAEHPEFERFLGPG